MINFSDFNQDYRYAEPPVASRLVLALSITDFRPEAMRVSERSEHKSVWYEVEAYDPRQKLWIWKESHDKMTSAVYAALNRYPEPEPKSRNKLKY